MRSSICPFVGLTTTSGSTRPVGRTICSTTCCGHAQLVRPGRRRHEHALVDPLEHLVELQRAVVAGGREAEAVLDEHVLAAAVALVLPVQLGHRLVALVDDEQEVVGEVVEQGERRLAVVAAVDVHRVVLDAVAVADLAHHLQVVLRAHPQPLRLEQLALGLEPGQPLLQLGLDLDHRLAPSARRRRRSGWPGTPASAAASRSVSPVIGSMIVSRSTVSPNISMRSTDSSYVGCTSMVSPRTRKRPRPSTASLRSNCRSTSRRRMLRMS